jgi:methyltransferase family protein
VLLDFGPVIGGNVGFFGERLGCKLFIEDLLADVDRHTRAGTLDALAKGLETRFRHQDGSVDGILCWDCFDFLDKAAVSALARQIVRLLRPGGAVMGFFCTSSVQGAGYTKYEIVDDNSLRHRSHAGVGGTRHAIQNRDIIRMFEGLTVSDSFLLKNNTREMLLRRR